MTIFINDLAPGYTNDYVNGRNTLVDVNRFYNLGLDIERIDSGTGNIEYIDFGRHGIPGLIRGQESNCLILIVELEGLHEIDRVKQYLSSNKRYIFVTNNIWQPSDYPMPFEYCNLNTFIYMWQRVYSYLNTQHFNFFVPIDYKFETKKKFLFYSTVGQQRPNRTQFVESIHQNCSGIDYKLTYSGKDYGSTEYHRYQWEPTEHTFRPYDKFAGYEKHHLNLSETLPLVTWNQAYFSLVVETQTDYLHSFFITEKTTKPLLTGMPFVLFGNCHHLKNLRSLGFKTYNSLWDESYDDAEIVEDRIKLIVKLVNSLKTFDWSSNLKTLQDIATHNRAAFFNLRNIERDMHVQNSTTLRNFLL